MQKDVEQIDEDGPLGELGLDLPEMNPRAARSAVADNAANVDADVVARQRCASGPVALDHAVTHTRARRHCPDVEEGHLHVSVAMCVSMPVRTLPGHARSVFAHIGAALGHGHASFQFCPSLIWQHSLHSTGLCSTARVLTCRVRVHGIETAVEVLAGI